MYGVKRESNEEICRGCFSTDRRLSPLANYDLFFSLLDDSQKLEALKSPTMHLCWECNASLRRMKLFQTQVKHAHRLLQELEGELPNKGLSQLSIYYKQDYDVVIEEGFDGIKEPFILPKEETKVQTDILNHNLNSDDDHCTEDTDNLQTHPELKLIVDATENSLEESIPRKKYKRKLKQVETKSSLQTKSKRKKIVTVPIQKGNRAGLRSSGDNIPSLYPNRNNGNKKDFKDTKIKVSNTIKRDFKQPKRKRCLNRRDPSPIVKKKKENQTLDGRDTTGKDLQNEVTDDDKAEANTDSELENLHHIKNTKQKIEIDDIEQNNHLDESDSENDNGDDDDPDFEEKYRNSDNSVKIKKKGVATRDSCLHYVCLRFDMTNHLDEYFTKVDLGPEEVKHVLDNELSYKSEEQPYSCIYCGLCFQMSKTLIIHKRNRHKQIAKCTNPVYLMYKCNICHKIIRKEHIEAHMKYLHRWRYYCKECDKDFWDKEEGKSHYSEFHKAGKGRSCGQCNYVCAFRKAMERHVRDRHTPVSCDVCGKTTSGAYYMTLHKRRHLPDGSAPELRYCVSCDKQFLSLSYEAHIKPSLSARDRHTPVSCDVCGKTTSGAYYMTLHKRRHLPDGSAPELRYCVSCDKQFLSLYTYESHIRNSGKHDGKLEEKIPCTECGRLITGKRSLQLHYDRFHSDKTRFQCPHCDKYYSRKSGLLTHIDGVHLKKKPPKDKLCSICGRGFALSRVLIHHIRTHTGERPHVCPHCPAAFAQPFPLQKHLATQHGEAPAAQNKSEAPATQA